MQAKFIKSSQDWRDCPEANLPEVAFIGRSNVGKSSLINSLTRQEGLAKVSSTPGKTLLINHFLINGSWYLVDLPGYGYANTPRAVRETLEPMIRHYALHRENLYCLFVLLDSRHAPQRNDLAFLRFLGENGVPFALVFTKADKLGPVRLQINVDGYLQALRDDWEQLPPHFITSARLGHGRDELLRYISSFVKKTNSTP